MTRYILENLDARGTYYVDDAPPRTIDQRHTVRVTKLLVCASGFDSATEASLKGATLPGRWQWVAA